jgi:glycosyltransferase involved in cell wall biosynthesis
VTLRVIAFVPQPPASASGRYRVYQMAPALARHGVELDVRPYLDERGFSRLYRPSATLQKGWDLARGALRRWRDFDAARGYPLALVHREAWPLVGYAPDRRLAGQGTGWVYDFDDAVFLPNVSAENRGFMRLKPFGQPARLVAGARGVAAGNGWLADWARRQRPGRDAAEVEVIPSAVDTEAWAPRPRDPGPPRLLWLGSPSTVGFLAPLTDALARLARRHPGLELHVIGARFAGAGVRVIEHPWSADTEVSLAARCDIGLSPLSDDDWSRGKCGLKLLLYMALGIPAVASPVGVHVEMVRHGENGMLAVDPPAFEAAIARLLEDPSLRAALGRAARETVLDRYSIAAVAPRLAALLRRAAERG